jgi:uncharacterized membrane protein
MTTHLRRYLITGLLVWVPLGVTLLVIKLLVDLMDQTLLLLPPAWRPEALVGFSIPGLGLVLSAVVVFITGMVAANVMGKRLVHFWEAVLQRIPVVRSIHTGVKQVVESLLVTGQGSFRKVLLIEYPRRGLWTLAFQTGTGAGEAQHRTGEDVINVFVPTTPNPTSGFFIMVPRREVVELEMSVDDGLKMIISAGVVVPPMPRPAARASAQVAPTQVSP